MLAARASNAVFVLVFGGRYRIDAGQPAIKIDISTPARTERAQTLVLRLAANDAGSGLILRIHASPIGLSEGG